MKVQAIAAAQILGVVTNKMTPHKVISIVALHFERRLTRPPLAQSRSMTPNKGWYHSHSCRRGELRAAAHAAISMNTVVGSPGTNTPMIPSTRHMMANDTSAHRTSRGSVR